MSLMFSEESPQTLDLSLTIQSLRSHNRPRLPALACMGALALSVPGPAIAFCSRGLSLLVLG